MFFAILKFSAMSGHRRDGRGRVQMIDNLSILLSHGLLLLTFWLLSRREDLDVEAPPERDPEPQGFGIVSRAARTRTKGPPPDA